MPKHPARGNGPALPAALLSRRALLAGLPIAATTLAAPALAGEAEDPILPYYREWIAATREWLSYAELPGNGNWDMPASRAAAARIDAAFFAMIEMTPVSMAGIAALAHVIWDSEGPSGFHDSSKFVEECAEPGNKLMLAIWRAASGESGLPPGWA